MIILINIGQAEVYYVQSNYNNIFFIKLNVWICIDLYLYQPEISQWRDNYVKDLIKIRNKKGV
ncbi:hypothetical protein GCM10007855_11420 [Aliivibrio sifiae]|uniref:Uncharacterized protein n=1 Tax=Aliivibrio sifiae TaxID=566293 RepID=A0ABQ6AJA4_9GAMM|nr:hypothetical protein GCM10007855_11420 [Aliivibrio sifiae]